MLVRRARRNGKRRVPKAGAVFAHPRRHLDADIDDLDQATTLCPGLQQVGRAQGGEADRHIGAKARAIGAPAQAIQAGGNIHRDHEIPAALRKGSRGAVKRAAEPAAEQGIDNHRCRRGKRIFQRVDGAAPGLCGARGIA